MSPFVTGDKAILVVEDDAASRESLREFLEYHGYKVKCAENGNVALEQIETAKISPRLILLDLSMPAMDGWTFLRCIRQRCGLREVAILVISGDGSAPISHTAAVLLKPVDPKSLLSLIKRFVGEPSA